MSTALPLPTLFSKSTRRNSSKSFESLIPSTALSEALRSNPFGTGKSISSPADSDDTSERRATLNEDLLVLFRLFPDIKAEVLRELLLRFEGLSRLHISVEQLLKYRAECVRGRWQMPPRNITDDVPLEETFRSDEYRDAAKTLLYLEYRSLSRSTVDAVLAEGNWSYTAARPTLRDLSKKTWRVTFSNLNIFRKKKEADEPPGFIIQKDKDGTIAEIKATGSQELDIELFNMFQKRTSVEKRQQQEIQDRALAETINLREAEEAKVIYECDCCCSDTTFESMTACTTNGHIICFDCIRHTINESIFGQGWGKSIDIEHGTLKCISPSSGASCEGCLPQDLVRYAVTVLPSGDEIWDHFCRRLSTDALLKSQLVLVHCPFCSYAEADPLFRSLDSPLKRLRWHFRTNSNLSPGLTTIITLEILPMIFLLALLLSFLIPSLSPRTLFHNALHNIALRTRSPRFQCQLPSCSRPSCLRCLKPWHDPHICHEPLLLSLRTTVEAARTSAIKRTCPRCGLSFVKASGCNKLTCVCGYAMCYLCRKSLNHPDPSSPINRLNPARALAAAQAQPEGYNHFCSHFRVNPGRPCDQCDKCDLYRAEDEDLIVRRAGEEAEKEWRVKEGMIGVEGFGDVNPEAETRGQVGWLRAWKRVWRGEWTVQSLMEAAVEKVVVVEV